MDTRPVVFCDFDGVACDLHVPWLDWYNVEYGDNVQVSDILSWHMHEFVKPECGSKIYDYLVGGWLYETAPPVLGALDGVTALRMLGCRVVFATSTGRSQADAKRDWLEHHGFLAPVARADAPHPDIIYVIDKSLLRGDVLIDDYHENLTAWGHRGVLFSAPWNQNVRGSWHRANNWLDVVQAVAAIVGESATQEAQRLVHGHRGADYGHPLDDFGRTAGLWSAQFGQLLKPGITFSPADVWQAMVLVKLSRERNRPKRDNRVDIAGYAETGQMVHDEQERRAKENG